MLRERSVLHAQELPPLHEAVQSESELSSMTPEREIPTLALGLPDEDPYDSIFMTRSKPSMTSPKTWKRNEQEKSDRL